MSRRRRDPTYSSSSRPASESSCKSRRQGSSWSAETSQANNKVLLTIATTARHPRIPFFVWGAHLYNLGSTFRCDPLEGACTIRNGCSLKQRPLHKPP